jgi:Fe-S-cluster containining protein
MSARIGSSLAAMDAKCGRCLQSKCCTYITQALDTPRSKADFEHLLWQVSHAGVEVYKDDSGWFLLVHSRCEHLQPGGSCGIYAQRPRICREYDNSWCELDAPAEESFSPHFRGHAELLAYCRKRFKTWGA